LFYHINKNNGGINTNLYRNRYVVNIKRGYHSSSQGLYSQKRFTLSMSTVTGLQKDKGQLNLYQSDQFGHYLAGLIEAQNSAIIVPTSERSRKGQLTYPSIKITFDSRDIPLTLLLQKELGAGSLSKKKKGANAYVLTFNSRESIPPGAREGPTYWAGRLMNEIFTAYHTIPYHFQVYWFNGISLYR